ncbi:MAG TPA: NHL repeat-containing protein, partial [Pseudomonadales bacterium]|nr:NHL repeat-containing protein [Pseudomonadales bacterium]
MKNAILTGLTRVALRSAVIIAAFAGTVLAQPLVKTMGGGVATGYFGYKNTNTLYSLFHTPMGMAVSQNGQTVFVADRDNNAVRFFTDFASPNNGWTFTFTTNFISKPVGVALDAGGDVYVLNRGTTNNIATNGTVLEFDQYGFFIKTNAYGLTNAAGILLDPYGNIYVTERSNLLVQVIGGTNVTVATVTNASASLQGIALMPGGLIAACDSGRNGIYVINPANGLITTNAGFNGPGDGTGFNNQGIPAYRAQFLQPMGVAAAGDGTLIVSDFGNGHVKVITTAGVVTNLYGVISNDWAKSFPGWLDGQVVVPDLSGGVASRCPVGVALTGDGTTIYTTEDFYHLCRKVTGQSFAIPIQPQPTAPTGLTATLLTNQANVSVLLTWNMTPNTANYVLSRSTSQTGYSSIDTTTGTSFTDTNVNSGTAYSYVVQSQNNGGESGYSAPATIQIPIQPPPPPVIGWFYYSIGVPIFNSFTNGPNVFQNDISLTILANVTGDTTEYADGPSPYTNNVIGNASGAPTFNDDGQPRQQTPLSVIATSNLTVEAYNVNTVPTP